MEGAGWGGSGGIVERSGVKFGSLYKGYFDS